MRYILLAIFLLCTLFTGTSYPYLYRNSMYQIDLPAGWVVKENTGRPEEHEVNAVHPNGSAAIFVKTFKEDNPEKIFVAPEDFARRVPLALLKQTCPSATLYRVSPINDNGLRGLESSMVCEPYYYTDIKFVNGNDMYTILASFVDNQYVGEVVQRSVSSFKILKKAKRKSKKK